ncbi:hypothetical protein R9X47_02410 [Wukongibacter baidiensis]|uniref:hypothetical protein n=1 Tax=Wukongibacter baidiensis TaxID=1723361 RepID=UPI003D7FEA0E
MMYYKIEGEKNTLSINLNTYESKLKGEEALIIYYDSKKQSLESPIFHLRGYIFVKDEVKKVLEIYDGDIVFKQIVFLDSTAKKSQCYWLIELKPIDCISEKSKLGFGKSAKELIVRESSVKEKDVLTVSTLKGNDGPYIRKALIISLTVAESLLRRKITGIRYEKVRVEEGE